MKNKGLGTTKIIIRNLTRRGIPRARSIKGIIKRIFELEKNARLPLSVTYVTDGRIRKLNRKYRGKDSPTDVLAFSMKEGRHLAGEDGFLGDVIISVDAAERQAKYFKTTKQKELKLYLIHGILHLLGYNDKTKADLRKMKRREEKLFKKI